MKTYSEKDLSNSVRDVDDKARRVKIAISQMDTKDLDNDVIDKNAYNKTITERGPKGANLIWHLTDHNASLKSAVGKFSELYTENGYLVGVTDISKTAWGNDVLEFYKAGSITNHSIGFKSVKAEPVNKGKEDEYNLIKEILLYEGSAVLWGSQPNTPTLSVGKSLTKEEITDEYAATILELNKLSKLFKSGHLSDESFELIEIKVSQLTDKLQHLFNLHTQPAVKAVEPQKLEDVFNNFINTLKRQDNGRSTIEIAT